jgi:crotonobetainyl-CoA:carnitine CoA-transferase CaiB-like acyl-CoA transferase
MPSGTGVAAGRNPVTQIAWPSRRGGIRRRDGQSARRPTRPARCGPSPEFGQHTEEVLLELGHDWEQIIALKEASVIP